MQRFHVHINANTPDQLTAELKEAAYILTGLLLSVKQFDEEYGSVNARRKNEWKQKAIDWLQNHKVAVEANTTPGNQIQLHQAEIPNS